MSRPTPTLANTKNTPLQAEVFRSGDDLLVRLPRGVKLRPKVYRFAQTNNGVELIDPALVAKRSRELDKLWGMRRDLPKETA
jgi:hypothetical protein